MPKHIRTRSGNPSYRILHTLLSFALIPAIASPQAPTEPVLGEKLAHEYEKQAGLGNTPELDGISGYINSVGSRLTSVLSSHLQYHFVFDLNPAFKSAFALPGGYIIVGGGLLALT